MASCCNCRDRVQAAVKAENFLFRHPNPSDFGRSQWFKAKRVYVVYRAVVFCYYAVWLCLYGDDFKTIFPNKVGVFFIYLTDWSFVVLVSHLLGTLVVAVVIAVKDVKDDVSTTSSIRGMVAVSWVLQTVAQDMALLVTIGYWGWVRGFEDKTPPNIYNINVHALNSVYVVVDIFVSAAPWRAGHFWVVQCYGIVYVIFTAIYWAAGGTDGSGKSYIYPVIDYSSYPGYAAVSVILGVLVAIPMAHLFLFGLYKLRRKLHECVMKRTGRYQLRVQQTAIETPETSGVDNQGFLA